VIVSFGNETRGLDSLSGRTLWSTRLTGVPTSGIVVEGQESAVYLVAAKTDQLFLLDTLSGQLKRETKLAYRPIGPPVSFPGRGFLLPFREGSIELFGLDGESVRRFALGRELTTLPVVAETSRGWLVLVGTRDGLLSLDLKSGQVINQTRFGNGDYPIGVLSLSGETAKANGLFLITSGGKIASIDLRANTIKWMVSAPTRTGILYVADVNADGQADVVLPGAESFAVALSGVDGSLVSSTDTLRQIVGRAAPRLLLASRLGERKILVSGNDPGDAGVRGMELHVTAVNGNRN
jgi:hypothetical protein